MIHVGSFPTEYLLYDPLLDKYQNSRNVVFIKTWNYSNFQQEHKLEVQNQLVEHDYALALVTNARQQNSIDNCIPNTYGEALKSPLFSDDWNAAISAEYESIERQKVWHLVERQPNINIIDTKWVFIYKYNANNTATLKAHLVARGFKDSIPTMPLKHMHL